MSDYNYDIMGVNNTSPKPQKPKKKVQIVFNSPVVLSFSGLCLLSLFLGWFTHGVTNNLIFSVYRSSLLSPLTYVRFFGHVLGHANFEHFIGNITLILVIGPMLEEKYGSKRLLQVVAITAFITGLCNFVFFPHVQLLGASGVVFAFILLASFTSFKQGQIPMTFILVAVVYLGQQVYQGIFVNDNVANLTHIIGGLIGAYIGYTLNKKSSSSYDI